MTQLWQHSGLRTLALILLCLVLYLPGQSTLPPFDRDEARFAQATKQMVESGDYVDIRFQDQPRHKKPIGIYWLQSISVNLTGAVDSIWAYRIPSWLGAMLAVVMTSLIGARFFGPFAGLLAGGMLATCLLLGLEARLAKTDAVLLATVTLTQYVLARLWQERALSKALAVLFWLSLGAGILIKGPIVLIPALSVMLGLSLLQHSAAWLKPLQPLWGVPLCLLVVAPWLIAITLKTHGQFWQESVGQDLLAKAAGEQESHGGPPGYYAGTVFLTFWPWAVLLIPAALYAWQQRRAPLMQFLLMWLVPFWVLFELFPTKLLHYTLPVFPALALLCASMLTSTSFSAPRLRLIALGLGALFLAVIAIGIPLAPLFAFPAQMPLSALSLGAGLLLAGSSVAYTIKARKPVLAAGIGLFTLVNFYAAFYGQQFPAMDGFWMSRGAAQLIAPYRATCTGPVTAIGYAEPSLVFYLGTDTVFADDWTAQQAKPVTGCKLFLIEQQKLQPADITSALGVVRGFNYSKGHAASLYLLRQQDSIPKSSP